MNLSEDAKSMLKELELGGHEVVLKEDFIIINDLDDEGGYEVCTVSQLSSGKWLSYTTKEWLCTGAVTPEGAIRAYVAWWKKHGSQ